MRPLQNPVFVAAPFRGRLRAWLRPGPESPHSFPLCLTLLPSFVCVQNFRAFVSVLNPDRLEGFCSILRLCDNRHQETTLDSRVRGNNSSVMSGIQGGCRPFACARMTETPRKKRRRIVRGSWPGFFAFSSALRRERRWLLACARMTERERQPLDSRVRGNDLFCHPRPRSGIQGFCFFLLRRERPLCARERLLRAWNAPRSSQG